MELLSEPMSAGAILTPLDGRRESLTTLVYEAIRDAIVSKQLPPGHRLSEASLAEQLNVSKTPVREALLRLAAVGLVESEDSRGLRVVAPSRQRIQHAYEVRGAHEFATARLAASRAGGDVIGQIAEAAAESVRAAEGGDGPAFRRADAFFHRTVAAASGNKLLANLAENSFTLTWALRSRDARVTSDSVECSHQHVKIGNAIERHDADSAGPLMLRHINKVMQMVLSSWEDSDTSV